MSFVQGASGASIMLGALVLVITAAVAWWLGRQSGQPSVESEAPPAPLPPPSPVAPPAPPAPPAAARASSFPTQDMLADIDQPTRIEAMVRAMSVPDSPNRLTHAGPPTVLVVEDNPVNAMVAKRLLEQLGCVVHHAENGLMGVAAVNTRRYDLVFMDCDMPVMDGYDATRAIRALDSGAIIPILALTAHSLEENRVKCIDAGMNDFLVKPVRREVLQSALSRWLTVAERAAAPA